MLLTKTLVAKEIPNSTFADSCVNYIDLFVILRRPKNKMVAMVIKPTEKLPFWSLSHACLTRMAGAEEDGEGQTQSVGEGQKRGRGSTCGPYKTFNIVFLVSLPFPFIRFSLNIRYNST